MNPVGHSGYEGCAELSQAMDAVIAKRIMISNISCFFFLFGSMLSFLQGYFILNYDKGLFYFVLSCSFFLYMRNYSDVLRRVFSLTYDRDIMS